MKGFAKKYPKEKAAPMASPSAKLWKASPSTTFKLDLTSGLPLPCYFTYHMFHSYHTGRRGYGGFLGNFLHLNFVLMFKSVGNLLPFTVSEVETLGQCEVYLGGGSPTLERVKVVFSAITPPSSIPGR